jgi:tetratricopeptide (TPR) repeat protein
MMKNMGFVVAFSGSIIFWSIIAFAQPGPGNRAEMSIPGVSGILQLDVGATTFQTAVSPDGKEVELRAFDRPDRLGISAFLQRVTFPASAEKCRDEWWPATKKSAPMKRDDLDESQVKDGIARVEYIVPEFRGHKIHQKTIHAYLGSGNLCAEIHLSKAGFEPDEQKLFEQILSTVKLLPDQAPSSGQSAGTAPADDTVRYLGEGSRSYLQRNYSSAARSYQKALDLERQKRTLPRDTFRVLVDNLGMSYGIGGDLQKAKETFEYGLTQEPDYPMFYYNLACTYGEMKKMPEAIEELRLAYKYKANIIAGETMPDPIKDDSFRYFVGDNTFVKAVADMQK